METVFIKATSLSDAWFQTLYKCVDIGRTFTIDKGSFAGQKRCEFDYITIQITNPDALPLLPQLAEGSTIPNPVDDNYLDDYLPYLMTGEEKEGESYTYGQRICAAEADFLDYFEPELYVNLGPMPETVRWTDPETGIKIINQMELMIYTYKNLGFRNNQMIMQVGQPSDMALLDPPCLRHIDTRIQDGALHFFPYFRSWDLFGGFPANLAAIEMMKQYCAAQIGVENGQIIASSKGLHIYDYTWEIAEIIRGKSMGEFKKELEG